LSQKNYNTREPLCNQVTVNEIKPQQDCGCLRAFATIHLPDFGFTIRYIRVVKQEGMRAYAALPQTEFYTKSGKKHFAPILTLPESLKKEICASVLAAWEAKQQ